VKASLIIPTLERQAHVRVLLASLSAQTEQTFETIIVDQTDAPDESVRAMAAAAPDRFQYLHIERKSLPNGRNVGARVARSDTLIFIDDDVELSPGFIAAHLAAHALAATSSSPDSHGAATSPSPGSHGAATSPSPGSHGAATSPSPNSHGAATSPSPASNKATDKPWRVKARSRHIPTQPAAVAGRITGGYDDGDPAATIVGTYNPWLATVTRNFHVTSPAHGIAQLPGGNFSVTKSAFFAAGGFDAEGFCGTASIGEESDFALRLVRTGGRIDFSPDAHLVHLHLPMGGCRDRSVVTWTYWHGHNMALLAKRHSGWWRVPIFAIAQVFRYIVHGLKRRSLSVTLAGWRGLCRGILRHVAWPKC